MSSLMHLSLKLSYNTRGLWEFTEEQRKHEDQLEPLQEQISTESVPQCSQSQTISTANTHMGLFVTVALCFNFFFFNFELV